ncbi:MAG: alpha-amylase family glycosyl hydrolase [Salinivirgaceae bacterium]
MRKILNALLFVFMLALVSCNAPSSNNEQTKTNQRVYTHVDWSKNANIYEVNIRQYTPEGTFNAFADHLPRLQQMGVDILWLMPIHPISEKNRKGSKGSYYAVQDYQKVNPEFGTFEDFKSLVDQAHNLGMKVIIDWVANHTGWDNWLIEAHNDWYTKDSLGNIVTPVEDWSDVADLNYEVPELREYMTQSLEYWVREANIDGYRCDVAGMVPLDFWISARTRLDAIKPVFMLAEWESKDILAAFDMIYGWEFHHIMNQVAQGKKNTSDIITYFNKVDTLFDADDYLMNFITNHDENSWNGTEFERMGDAVKAMAVLAHTAPGMPLIYTGQEAKLNKRLLFFEKDAVEWGTYEFADFYKKLLLLKKNNKALWNGTQGGPLTFIENSGTNVLTFSREKENDKVVVMLNLSNTNQEISFINNAVVGNYNSLFTQTEVTISDVSSFNLGPWDYKVLVKNN